VIEMIWACPSLPSRYQDAILGVDLTENEIIKINSVDYNDTQIAKLESDLKSINTKVEAYA